MKNKLFIAVVFFLTNSFIQATTPEAATSTVESAQTATVAPVDPKPISYEESEYFVVRNRRSVLIGVVTLGALALYKEPKITLSITIPLATAWLLHRMLGDNFHTVESEKLYRSMQLSPKNLEDYIKKYGIKSVINLRGEQPDQSWWIDEKNVCEQNNVAYFNLLMAAENFSRKEDLQRLLEIYDAAPTPMLIHCLAGTDRTGEAAALWCIEKMGMSNQEAMEQMEFLKYHHCKWMFPKKDLLIEFWGGRTWLDNDYQPELCCA